jgi:2-polyprenyl-6-hydroxyphenyl methylase/3-demethylubiquinone-9 3-methyltransferase
MPTHERPSISAWFPPDVVRGLAASLSQEARDESAIPSYTHWNPAIRWLMFRRLERIRRMAQDALDAFGPGPAGRALLDFGCGVGMLIPALAPRVETLYVCDEEIAPARATAHRFAAPNAICLLPRELAAGVADASLDVVIAADVLEHVADLPGLLAQLGRKLRSGGVLLVSGPTESLAYRLGRRVAGFSGHYHVRSVFDVERDLAVAGFAREALRVVPIVPPLFRITRWRRAR